MSAVVTSGGAVQGTNPQRARASLRPWYKWLLTALAFPPAGYLAHGVVGRVDSVTPAFLGGVIAGAGVGAAQWAVLRRRGVGLTWVAVTAAGLGVGLAAGAVLVSYRTDLSSLAVMGAVSGLGVGVAQGVTLGNPMRALLWGGATAVLWAVGWTVTVASGVDVDEQWIVFGISGALVFAFLQSVILGAFVPAEADGP